MYLYYIAEIDADLEVKIYPNPAPRSKVSFDQDP